MGLATSQVRLLALTSRKADVEMQIQLNSKRKTMLTRESSELAKLYHAKLQNSKIQFATTNGYKDVTYNYLMGSDSASYMATIAEPSRDYDLEKKTANEMILTDAYGRVILSDNMLTAAIDTLNEYNRTPGVDGTGTAMDTATISDLSIMAIGKLLEDKSVSGGNDTLSSLNTLYQGLLYGKEDVAKADGNICGLYKDGDSENLVDETTRTNIGREILTYLYQNGVKDGGILYEYSGKFYTDATRKNEVTPTKGVFYVINSQDDNTMWGHECGLGNLGGMWWSNNTGHVNTMVPYLSKAKAQQICNLFSYYGNIFSAAFNGTQQVNDASTTINLTDLAKAKHFNIAAEIEMYKNTFGGPAREQYRVISNEVYDTVNKVDNIQAGLKSGLYQLVNVSSIKTGGYSKAQGLNYFETMNYIVEKADTAERETITAWYEAAKADLSTKESYWDSEITALSAELNTITTEIDSVKSLRKDAIDSTFKWGSA